MRAVTPRAAPPDPAPYAAANAAFAEAKAYLSSREAQQMSESDLERELHRRGRELMCKLLQGHLEQRSPGEAAGPVEGADGVERSERRVHERHLETISAITGVADVEVVVDRGVLGRLAAGGPGENGTTRSSGAPGGSRQPAGSADRAGNAVPLSDPAHEPDGLEHAPRSSVQRRPMRRRMASTRSPGTYSPRVRTGRRDGGDALAMFLRSTAAGGPGRRGSGSGRLLWLRVTGESWRPGSRSCCRGRGEGPTFAHPR